mmetsp:Transcript_42703/g.100085  ORF Transcript_42703/g.100085 Transcript_42703/m.100085 type:complete len:208 (+) Transcript_42703:570-1193(+)
MPAMTPEVEPEPVHMSTCTATTVTRLAMPQTLPPAVDAQCVPWPWHGDASSITPRGTQPAPLPAAQPASARPPKSVWLMRTPVSRTYSSAPSPLAPPSSYTPSSGSARWSVRSRPHVAPSWTDAPSASGVRSLGSSSTVQSAVMERLSLWSSCSSVAAPRAHPSKLAATACMAARVRTETPSPARSAMSAASSAERCAAAAAVIWTM